MLSQKEYPRDTSKASSEAQTDRPILFQSPRILDSACQSAFFLGKGLRRTWKDRYRQ